LIRSLIVAGLVALGLPMTSAAASAVSQVDCQPEALIQLSNTYGTIHHFGARCDHSLNVTVNAKVWRDGVRVGAGSVRCTDTSQRELCDSYELAGNPRGKQRFRLVVEARYDMHGVDDLTTVLRTVATMTA
jgi:hypothetical protein